MELSVQRINGGTQCAEDCWWNSVCRGLMVELRVQRIDGGTQAAED